jgi:hypothetical protein
MQRERRPFRYIFRTPNAPRTSAKQMNCSNHLPVGQTRKQDADAEKARARTRGQSHRIPLMGSKCEILSSPIRGRDSV